MSLPRVVMVSRRFWPLVGGAETAMAGLAASFQARGAATTLLTARWKPEWPLTIEHRGVRVVRIAQPARRFWGSARYMLRLAGWLEAHSFDIDAYTKRPLVLEAGEAVAPNEPGLGVVFDWERLLPYEVRVSTWSVTSP